MTQQFHEGQEVEVKQMMGTCGNPDVPHWRKANILCRAYLGSEDIPSGYKVEFPDGLYEVFDAANIRAVKTTTTILDSGPLTVKVTHIP